MTRFNFKGWNFVKWVVGNKSTLLELVKVGVPFLASTFVVDPIWQQFLITIVGKFALDSVHYWVNE